MTFGELLVIAIGVAGLGGCFTVAILFELFMRIEKPTPRHKEKRSVSAGTRDRVFVRDHFTCQWCRSAGGALDPHHRLMRSQGGSDHAENLVTVHRICHDYIHDHPLEARSRGFLLRDSDEPGIVDAGGWASEDGTPSGATAQSTEDDQ